MNKVVARFKDGRIVRGTTLSVDPARPTFHVRTQEGKSLEVQLSDLKAVFFVRSLEGDSKHNEDRSPDPEDPRHRGSILISMAFADGEVMVGLMNAYPPTKPYFFVVPVDKKSNNIRILINRAALAAIDQLKRE
jgi:hypothetical protein